MTTKNVLIVDDEIDICELVEITLGRMGLCSRSANDLRTAKSLLDSEAFDLCLTDMKLPDGCGITLVEHIQKHHPQLPIAVITAHGNMESAIKALKAGAFDFVSKPVDINVLRNLINSAIKLPTPENIPGDDTNSSLIGKSAPMQALKRKIDKLARSQAPVFIHGESGSGKERVARLIHQQGPRIDHPFIPVNCGAIPAELMESEFFGHTKGSFTGATTDKPGLFQAANGGTLFLDEVAELPLHMQVKLLRAIQEKAVRPVGTHQEIPVDVRILSASHRNLASLVRKGSFREDLYYRINVIELHVPPLRERKADIPDLADHLLKKLSTKSNGAHDAPIPSLSDEALQALQNYGFPGNVRELENILERALALAENHAIEAEDLHLPSAPAPQSSEATQPPPLIQPSPPPAPATTSLDDLEKHAIVQALEQTRWNKTAAAKMLGLTLRQLRYRLSKLDI